LPLLLHHFNLPIDYLAGKPVNSAHPPSKLPASADELHVSDKRFDFAKRCRSGKRSAFGFMQSNPFIDRFTQLCIDCPFVGAMHSA
jgi:hypothetical protein